MKAVREEEAGGEVIFPSCFCSDRCQHLGPLGWPAIPSLNYECYNSLKSCRTWTNESACRACWRGWGFWE